MNELATTADIYSLTHKVSKSGAERVCVPTHAALRKIHGRVEGESRRDWDRRIQSIREEIQCSLDMTADAIQTEGVKRGMVWKSVVRKPNGEIHYVQALPKADDTLAKKRAALAKLQAEISALESETSETEAIEIAA